MSEQTLDTGFDILDQLSCDDDLCLDGNYQEQVAPTLTAPGKYNVQVDKWTWKKDKNNLDVIRVDDEGRQYGVIQLISVKIIEPVECAKTVYLFQDIDMKPFKRNGGLVSRAGDLLRAIDSTVTVRGSKEAARELADRLNSGATFRCRMDWNAYDGAYPKDVFERAGGKAALTKEDIQGVYTTSRVNGFRNIIKDNLKRGGDGKPTSTWIGPGGQPIEARVNIAAFIGQAENVQLGPEKEFLKK
jgi:hypothetical protein